MATNKAETSTAPVLLKDSDVFLKLVSWEGN